MNLTSEEIEILTRGVSLLKKNVSEEIYKYELQDFYLPISTIDYEKKLNRLREIETKCTSLLNKLSDLEEAKFN